jgi:hypothetical protein
MKLIGKAIALGFAVATASVVACSGQHASPTSQSVGGDSNTGQVGYQYTLPGGEQINSVSYTLTNGTNSYSGTIAVGGSSVISFVVGGVASGANYVLTLNATTADGTVSCTGSSAPFAVSDRTTTQVNVNLVCTTVTAFDAGSVTVGTETSNCPVWNTIVANPSSAFNGQSVTLNAAAQGPNPGALTFTWTVTTGTGTISNNTTLLQPGDAGTTDTATFTCPAMGGEVDTITLVVADGPLPTGGSCPATYTTGTVQVTCGSPPCQNPTVGTGVAANPPTSATGTCPSGQVNTGTLKDSSGNFCCQTAPCLNLGDQTEATPNSPAGTCPAGFVNNLRDPAGNYCCGPILPCTTAGQTGCVQCQGSTGGICSSTEAALVAKDVAKGKATAAGPDPAGSCYTCLLNGGCLDDVTFGDTGHECGDLGAGLQANCASTLSCILGSNCASTSVATCYCGTAGVSTTCQGNPAAGPINGACASQIATGLGFPVTDGTDNTKQLTNTTLASGMADQIFVCGLANGCTACQQ